MIETLVPLIGAAAAASTSLSYLPQVQKAWPRKSTHDLSWKTLVCLTAGLILWMLYGWLKNDYVIVAANAVGAALAGCVLAFKLRDLRSS